MSRARVCEVCAADITRDGGRCTNGRCSACHAAYCTGGGDTGPGHGRKLPAAVELGRLGGKAGGRSTSPAKGAASRVNGAKGGRPRKPAPELAPAPAKPTAALSIIKNTRAESRETATGRIVERTITSWDLTNTTTCELVSEHASRGAARRALGARLMSAFSDPD